MKRRRIEEGSLAALALAAMQAAVDEVIKDHARRGARLAVWRNGKVAMITAAEARREQARSGKRQAIRARPFPVRRRSAP